MRNKLATVRNVVNLRAAYDALSVRGAGTPGIALVHGFTGSGKTTAIAALVNQINGVFVRATAAWTPAWMLGRIMVELGAAPLHRTSAMLDHVVTVLAQSGRPLFVDEADYLFSNGRMLDILRDVHDLAGIAVVLIGMDGIAKRLSHRQQLARRISQWVEFQAATLADAHLLASTVCEVEIAEDLVSYLHVETSGNIGMMVVGMARIESFARANGWPSIDRDRWGRRPFVLNAAQPNVVQLQRR